MKSAIPVLLALLSTGTYAQVSEITGTVTTATNYPIRGAKVHSGIDKKSVFTDSSGNFTIPLHLPDNLTISYDGFTVQKINVTEAPQSPLAVHLSPVSATNDQLSNEEIKSQAIQGSVAQTSKFNSSITYGTGDISGTTFPSFIHKEDTQGSMYLLNDWANGIVTRSNNYVITNSSMMYNYDKMSGSLIMTSDMRTAVSIDRSQISRFTLVPKSSTNSITFVMQPLIGNNFVEMLADGTLYKLYKKIETTFKKADYRTTGLTSSGNNYDEYIDKYTYYLLTVKSNSVKEISLKQKAVKDALQPESQKTSSYFAQHRSNSMEEADLVDLINYLNQ